jgi:DNA-binding PadR family transcriptional regulator
MMRGLISKEGYLSTQREVVNGKVRKFYTITEQGLEALGEARRKITELVEEVIEERLDS